MKHELHQVKYIGCEPARWAAKVAILDQFDHRLFTERPMLDLSAQTPPVEIAAAGLPEPVVLRRADYDDDEDDDTDIWGDPLPKTEMDEDVAVIPMKGMIYGGAPSFFKKFGIIDLEDVAEDIEAAMGNPACRALVLDVDSPGGTLRSLPEFASMVSGITAAGTKPIAARVSGLGCSAAYYAIAGCTMISCAPSSESVNIGIYQACLNMTKCFEMFGYRMEIFKSGKYKAAGYPGTDLTDDQKQEIQGTIDELGAMFRAHVSASRPGADPANMQGQTFLGAKAVALGFADDDAPSMASFMTRFKAYLNAR